MGSKAIETKNYIKVMDAFPELKVKQTESYIVGSKLLVTEKFIAGFYNVSGRSVRLWREKGMPRDAITITTLNLYNLVVVIQWHLDTILAGKSKILNTCWLHFTGLQF